VKRRQRRIANEARARSAQHDRPARHEWKRGTLRGDGNVPDARSAALRNSGRGGIDRSGTHRET
jgi:hypothetical protein